MANGYFERGEIYWVRMDSGFGYEQGVGRPGVILSCDRQNNAAGMVTIAFCSKQEGRRDSWEVEIEATGCTSYVKCSQINTVDKGRLGKCIGVLNNAEMKELESVLEEFFDLGYVDDTEVKQKEAEIADRDLMIGELNKEIAGAKTEVAKKDEEIASLKMEIEMWQKCYGRCMDMLVDLKVSTDVSSRSAQKEPEEVVLPHVSKLVDPPKNPETPPEDPPEEPVEDDRLDINSCTATALKKIGFSLAMARKIVEGRPYKTVEDLKRINGMKASLYRVLEPKLCCVEVFAPVVEEDDDEVMKFEVPVEDVPQTVNVNTASAQEIHDITGISRQTCFSITGYRKKNGPYEKLEDLLPVHGIWPGTLKKCGDKIRFEDDASMIVEEKPVVERDPGYEKVNINTASAKEINEVTGLHLSAAYSITGYRRKNGPFEKLEDLLNVANIYSSTLDRIRPFLEV